jgi:hypothetical protein
VEKKEPIMPSVQGFVDELNEIKPEEMQSLAQLYKGSTPGPWVSIEVESPRSAKLPNGQDRVIFHAVSVSWQGKPFAATHFTRVEDTRFVAAVHAAFPGILLKLRNYDKLLIASAAKLDQERARTRDSAEKVVKLDAERKAIDTELSKARKLIEGLEAHKTTLAQESNAHAARVKTLAEELATKDKALAIATADVQRLKDEVAKGKKHEVGIRQERPIGVARKHASRRYLVNSLYFRQLPWTGCNFRLDPLTVDDVVMLCREGFTSHVSRRQPHLPKRLSELLGMEVRAGVGNLDLRPGDDAIILEYRGPHIPDERDLSAAEFRAWQMGLQFFHLRVLDTETK